MKIKLTEQQLQKVIKNVLTEENLNETLSYNWQQVKDFIGRSVMKGYYNFKPSLLFDRKHGTSISKKYRFPFDYSEDKIWRIINACIENNTEEGCADLGKVFDKFDEKYFPVEGLGTKDFMTKYEILMGMASNFNEDDIIAYSITDHTDEALEKLEEDFNDLEDQLDFTLQWKPSQQTVDKIRKELKLENLGEYCGYDHIDAMGISNFKCYDTILKQYGLDQEKIVQLHELLKKDGLDLAIKEIFKMAWKDLKSKLHLIAALTTCYLKCNKREVSQGIETIKDATPDVIEDATIGDVTGVNAAKYIIGKVKEWMK